MFMHSFIIKDASKKSVRKVNMYYINTYKRAIMLKNTLA